MRRRNGTGLVRNELRVLAASLRLAAEGTSELYGYELLARMAGWEGAAPMNHATLYRCLRALERRGMYVSQVSPGRDGPPRVCYELTGRGLEAARTATVQLAASEDAPAWVDIRHAVPVDFGHRPGAPVTGSKDSAASRSDSAGGSAQVDR